MKKFLIVVDMQKDFIDGALGSKEACAIVPNVVKKIKEFDCGKGAIFATFDTHFDNYMETNEGKHLPVSHCIKETDGWMLGKEIQEALADKEYTKVEKITFGSVDLPGMILEKVGVKSGDSSDCCCEESDCCDQESACCGEDMGYRGEDMGYRGEGLDIELVGLCTDICVVSNALVLKARFPEATISVDAACCAGVSPETHNAALDTMRCCQIEVK